MAIKLRRGLEEERQVILFEQGEIVYATDSKKVYIGDGLTVGGNLVTGEELLSKLDDVSLESLTNGDILLYNSENEIWENQQAITTNIPEGTNLYFTDTRVYNKTKSILIAGENTSVTFDDALQTITISSQGNVQSVNEKTGAVLLDTNDIPEGLTNVYYTEARFDTRLATKSTDDLTEGTNLYYTDARFDSRLATKTTDDLTEGTNQYYTEERVQTVLTNESVTKEGNTFNGPSELVKLTPEGKIPALDGSLITGLVSQGEVDSKQNNLIINANQGLSLQDSNLGTVYNTTIANFVNSISVGGATPQPASYWKSKSIVEVLDTILFPTLLASIQTQKSVNLSVTGSAGTLEIGQTFSRDLTATFNKGRIINGDTSTGPELVGLATQYTFTGTGILSTTQAGNTLAISNTIVSGSNNWEVTVNHAGGTDDYFDNKGNTGTYLDSSRVSGTVTDTTSSPSITGIYPYFWGISDTLPTPSSIAAIVQAGTANKVVLSSSGTVTVNFNATDKYLWMVHPAVYTAKTKWYVTALNNGNIGSPSDLFGAVNTQAMNSPDSYWSGVNYNVYISTFKTSLLSSLEFRNS